MRSLFAERNNQQRIEIELRINSDSIFNGESKALLIFTANAIPASIDCLRNLSFLQSIIFTNNFPSKCKAGSTRCVVRIRGASCVNESKRFVESDTYGLLWCVNLLPNWRTRCDEWTNDTSTQIRHIFSCTRCANHDTWRITNTNHASCGPSLIGARRTAVRSAKPILLEQK